MRKFANWWKQDKRYVTMCKAVFLGLLPVLCCLVYCAMQGKTIGQVYLPESEWNDELFYYKQVEGIVNFGYPLGYFGFNESHALKLSFAAWSPVLVFPWIIWGFLFGWNLMSPIICNIVLMTLCCFLFVWLVKPTWKQLGVLGLLFCLYTPFVRYMLSVMPEVICFSMLILFYGLAINYLQRERTYKLVLLFVMSGVMTLMRPYLLLFLLLPMFFWIRKSGWKGMLGSGAVLVVVLGVYAAIKHYLGAEYFAPLFFTDWVTAFFEEGFFGGIRYTLSKLYQMGKGFYGHTIQGLRTGLASGAFFAGYLVMMLVLIGQSFVDWRKWRRLCRRENRETGEQDAAGRAEQDDRIGRQLVIEAHLAFSFVAMLFALLLMYKLTEGSKHLLTFMAAGVFVVAMMETRFFKKAVLIGVTFAYLYSYMAVTPYDYQVPFLREERQAQVEEWRGVMAESMPLNREDVPNFDNVVIWVFSDVTEQGGRLTPWQLLYALPEGFGISCCMQEYVINNFEALQSRYIAAPSGGQIEERCRMEGCIEIGRDKDMVIYELRR